MPSTTFILILLFTLMSPFAESLRCLEGADCLRDASCDECEGVACTRVVSFNIEDNKEVALTCIPHDTRLSGFPLREVHLEAEGCRSTGDRQICVCYGRDYCNKATSLSFVGAVALALLH